MSCHSLAARALAEPDKDNGGHCGQFHRTVRFTSESSGRSSIRVTAIDGPSRKRDSESPPFAMTQSAPSTAFDLPETPAEHQTPCRFPKLEECAHFHYERVSLGGLSVEARPCAEAGPDWAQDEGWVCLEVQSHVSSPQGAESSGSDAGHERSLSGSWTEAGICKWTLTRNRDNFVQLDDMLHRCIYDRRVSGLPELSQELSPPCDTDRYTRVVSHYVHHLSMIADDSINCGPVLNWLQMDNKGHKLLVSSEDSSSINTPAVAAAYSVRKYVSQARDEISFDVGDMISIIDMPAPQESVWWRGKRGFRVGFFPRHCVAVIGDKVPRHMTQPPPFVGSVAVAPIKPVLRKHGKLISLFRSFILSRPSRRSLKQQGILRERVFGCDLGEHLLNCGHEVPAVLVACATAIESLGPVDGVYRLSGGAGLTQRLRAAFDSNDPPENLLAPHTRADPHAIASLLKMYFRELPNPLCTYQLYDAFVRGVQGGTERGRLGAIRDTANKLPPPHYRTLAYLMRHLRRVSLLGAKTGMTARNMAIVWAPNLLRSPHTQHALQGVAIQAVVTEFLICFAEEIFSDAPLPEASSGEDTAPSDGEPAPRRPKSLPPRPHANLLSLEEARRRAPPSSVPPPTLPGASLLRPQGGAAMRYIDVGAGPANLPAYHTVIDLPNGKRGMKRSGSGWRGLFRRRAPHQPPAIMAREVDSSPLPLRPVKSYESLASDDTLPPLPAAVPPPLKQHSRSASCDSYFEPWQAELAGMRLRLAPQERDGHMFSEEDDTALLAAHPQSESVCSSPAESIPGSAAPSPARAPDSPWRGGPLRFIDGESPRPHKRAPPPPPDTPKRLCKDRESPKSSMSEFQPPLEKVKLRERTSPRKTKPSVRYSGMHQPLTLDNPPPRLSWPHDTHATRDTHATLIKVDWPTDNTSSSNLTASTIHSPQYEQLDEIDSNTDLCDANKHTIKIESNCSSCDRGECLKCELKATDYENVKFDSANVNDFEVENVKHDTSNVNDFDVENDKYDSRNVNNDFDTGNDKFDSANVNDYNTENVKMDSPNVTSDISYHELGTNVTSDVSYQNLNRLSAISTSSNSDGKVMTSSHDSSSSYSKIDDYESFNFKRPSYLNLQSSSPSKSSPSSPIKSPLKSTISITFRSPKKSIDVERDSLYEDVALDKSLTIVEDATVPDIDACLPTQQACQPSDLINLDSPENLDVYSQVKFFKKSIDEVNAMILEPEDENTESVKKDDVCEIDGVVKASPDRHYENVDFDKNFSDCDVKLSTIDNIEKKIEQDNGNVRPKSNLNVRELAIRFESPTEQKGPFLFEKFKAEIKYPSLDRKEEKLIVEIRKTDITLTPESPKLTKNHSNARSLDENAFEKEFGERRKSFEIKELTTRPKYLPDLNLNTEESEPKFEHEQITPTTENKISLIQRPNVNFDSEKKLSRERIEKYKEERRNFFRERYSSQSFRSNPEQLKLKIKKEDEIETQKFERRNTVDLGQRMRFSLAKSANDIDCMQSPEDCSDKRPDEVVLTERVSPSYNIRDMTAMFEKKSQNNGTG